MTEVRMERTSEQPAITIRERIKLSDIPQFMDEAYEELWAEKKRNGWRMAGAPFAYYHSCSDQEVDVECGFPVAWPIEGSGRIRAFTLPSVRAATAMHIGPYVNILKTYELMERWIRVQGHEPAEQMWESYLNDPTEVPPEKLETKIFWPIK